MLCGKKDHVQEVEVLRQQVSNYEKDKMTLQLTKQRLVQADKQFKNLEWEKEVLAQRFSKMEKERDELYARFESSIFELQQKTGLKGVLLEKKLEAAYEVLEKKEAQLAEVLAASNLDPGTLANVRLCSRSDLHVRVRRSMRVGCTCVCMDRCVLDRAASSLLCLIKDMLDQLRSLDGRCHRNKQFADHCARRAMQICSSAVTLLLGVQVNAKLEEVLDNKNQVIKALKYDVAKVSKAHNDLIRVNEAKLAEFGIPAEELGFRPLVTNTGKGPAGLVVGT